MKIYSLSRVLVLPVVLISSIFLYLDYEHSNSLSIWIIVPVLLLVALYVFHGLIDHWWLKKFPVPFDPKLKQWLERYFPFYGIMNDNARTKFENRMTLYHDGRLFQKVGSELGDVGEDIKCMISAHGLLMSMNDSDYLIGDMDRIFLYKHPFPTPMYPYLHNVEVNIEDGVLIFSLEQMTNSILFPKDYFNIAYYAYGVALSEISPKKYDVEVETSLDRFGEIMSITVETMLQQIGLQDVNYKAIHMSLYFSHHESYKKVYTNNAIIFDDVFGTFF